jgi:hypothetical protein
VLAKEEEREEWSGTHGKRHRWRPFKGERRGAEDKMGDDMGHPLGGVDVGGPNAVPGDDSRPAWPEAGRCGRLRRRTIRARARLDRREQGLTGGPRYSPRRCGPRTCGPRPQCQGLNFPNRSISFKFEIQTRSNFV